MCGDEEASQRLPLVRIGSRVESVGAEVRGSDAAEETEVKVFCGACDACKSLSALEGTVFHCAVGALPASASGNAPSIGKRPSGAGCGAERAIGASFDSGFQGRGDGVASRDDVDGAAEGLTSSHARVSAVDDFDALHVGKIDGEVGSVVPGLRIDNGNAVNEKRNLVVRSSVDGNVRLNTKPCALTDIDTRIEFENVVETFDSRSGEFFASEGDNLSGCHAGAQRGT